jgi:hypothetical protein
MAEVKGRRTTASAQPYQDIKLYPVAKRLGLPKTNRALVSPLLVEATLFGVSIPYKLHPNVVDEQGEPRCVFYVAYNTRAGRNEFVVGPSLVDLFASNVGLYATAAGNFFGLTGYATDYQVSHATMVDRTMNGDLTGTVACFGDSWAQALQDPGWWAQSMTAFAAAGTPRPFPASTAARVGNPSSFPAVARALRTQQNLQGLKITRSVQLLEQPTVFRHTITYDPAPVSFARIEMDGHLRFASAGSAHYGEGVYAWRANSTGIGRRWIDIEVPAGTAAELIQTPSGSWYRLLGADGQTLPVRIVRHNFTPSELALGRAVLAP